MTGSINHMCHQITNNSRGPNLRCPSCGYVRKPEDIAPEWQCPACQIAYNKASQSTAPTYSKRDSTPPGAAMQSSGSPLRFKTVCIVALLGCLSYFGYSIAKDTSIVRSIGLSQADKELINNKKAELKAYEDGLQRIEAQIAHDKANVGTCSITGQPNIYILNQDPRPELQAKIDQLKAEIRQLEGKS